MGAAPLPVMKYICRDELVQRLPGMLGLLQELAQPQSGLEFLYMVLRCQLMATTRIRAIKVQSF